MFICKLKEKHKLPQMTVDETFADIWMNCMVERMTSQIKTSLIPLPSIETDQMNKAFDELINKTIMDSKQRIYRINTSRKYESVGK
jgi:hypothetical protein